MVRRPFFQRMDIKSKLDIAAVVRWEQMTGRSFLHMDFSCEEDMRKLLYCATMTGAAEPCTFEVFDEALQSRKVAAAAMRSLSSYSAFTAQFARKGAAGRANSEMSQDVTIGAIAAKLIVTAGMDARFVMHEMLVEDIPLYIEALNDKLRHEEESRRLWTFYAVLPHVDAKKLRNPQKLHLFPWEADEAARRAQEEMVRNEQELYRFLKGEMLDLNAVQWRKNPDYE